MLVTTGHVRAAPWGLTVAIQARINFLAGCEEIDFLGCTFLASGVRSHRDASGRAHAAMRGTEAPNTNAVHSQTRGWRADWRC